MTFTEGAENQGREEGSAAALELSAPVAVAVVSACCPPCCLVARRIYTHTTGRGEGFSFYLTAFFLPTTPFVVICLASTHTALVYIHAVHSCAACTGRSKRLASMKAVFFST